MLQRIGRAAAAATVRSSFVCVTGTSSSSASSLSPIITQVSQSAVASSSLSPHRRHVHATTRLLATWHERVDAVTRQRYFYDIETGATTHEVSEAPGYLTIDEVANGPPPPPYTADWPGYVGLAVVIVGAAAFYRFRNPGAETTAALMEEQRLKVKELRQEKREKLRSAEETLARAREIERAAMAKLSPEERRRRQSDQW